MAAKHQLEVSCTGRKLANIRNTQWLPLSALEFDSEKPVVDSLNVMEYRVGVSPAIRWT